MANHKSALKRAKQSENSRLRNMGYKTRSKNIVKEVREAVAEKDKEKAVTTLESYCNYSKKRLPKVCSIRKKPHVRYPVLHVRLTRFRHPDHFYKRQKQVLENGLWP